MYRCHLNIYLIGSQLDSFEILKGMSPLENFTHTFFQSPSPERDLTEKADAVFLWLEKENDLRTVLSYKKKSTALVVISEANKKDGLLSCSDRLDDVWVLPLSNDELKFRFLTWQKHQKLDKDYWESQNFLETTINSVPNLIWYKNKEGLHLKVNDSFCKTVNKSKEQVEGRDHFYIWDVDPNDPNNSAEDCAKSDMLVMEKGSTCISEETVQSGSEKKLLTTYKSPLYDIDGSVMGTVGVAIDITKERLYEQTIIEKNNTLESLFATIDCGVICHTVKDSRILSINHAALELLGYRNLDELAEDGFNVIAPTVMDEDKLKLKEIIKSLKRIGDSVNTEYRVQHKDGKIIHIMGSIKLLEENGEQIYQRFLVDCTSQRIQEINEREALKKYNANLMQALTVDYNLVCCIDLDTGNGYSIRAEDCALGIIGDYFSGNINWEQSMSHYIESCVYSEDREILRKAVSLDSLRKDLESSNTTTVNFRTICFGDMRYFQMKAVRAGEWGSGVVLGFRNIDREMHDEMEQKRILEEALMQANRANKAKSVFLSNMSHDIRTPMNAIVGFTALAMTHLEKKELVEDYLQKIMTSGNHLLSLINDILDMSRIESGKMHLDEKPCSLLEVIHGLRNIIQADVNSKQLDLFMDTVGIIDEEVICDKLRLNQVLLNLLSNAVKYTPAGGVVSLRVIEKPFPDENKANYRFIIKDTGIGMSGEFISRIFEPFERERNSTISRIQGTGLGMAITKNIVDMMNGTIEIKSRQNEGTEVTVSFDFSVDTDAKKPRPIPKLQGCRALVVDDDFNTCDSVSLMLQQLGMRAEWTLSGKEAVLRTKQAVSRKDNYQVYIIDWLLPDMNGVEVIRRIRKETEENVPIIILTAYDWSDIEEEAKEAGATAFCAKPLFFSELSQTLNEIISPETCDKSVKHNIDHKCRAGRLLLAEDVELNQEIAVAILSEAGFTVDVAENGQIAVDMLKASEPNYYQAVLMDIQMPVMDGYTAARAIRSLDNKALSKVPIIAMSANAFEEDKQEAIQSGMNEHIAKPVNIEVLFKTLDEILY